MPPRRDIAPAEEGRHEHVVEGEVIPREEQSQVEEAEWVCEGPPACYVDDGSAKSDLKAGICLPGTANPPCSKLTVTVRKIAKRGPQWNSRLANVKPVSARKEEVRRAFFNAPLSPPTVRFTTPLLQDSILLIIGSFRGEVCSRRLGSGGFENSKVLAFYPYGPSSSTVHPTKQPFSELVRQVFQQVLREMSQSDGRQHQKDGRPLCRYFTSNMCNKGEHCEFSHDRDAKPDMVCRYYLAGHCTYGSRCRYDHVRPNVLQSQRAIATAATSIEGGGRRGGGEDLTSASASSSSSRPPLPQEKHPIPPVQPMPLIPRKPLTNAWSKPLEHTTPSPSVFDDFSAVSDELARINSKMEQNLADVPLCPYFEMGYCINAESCPFIHGMPCSMCDRYALHPFNEQQRIQHHRECLAEHEALMEKAFAEARSVDKQCGICFEMIFEKSLRFGILQNCKHCYCLPCIRKWRQQNAEQAMENNIVRSCPECRVHSDFVVPSSTWTEDEGEKSKMISAYQANMKTKVCKYMSAGRVDDCPFGNRCFYKHQLPSGEVIEGDAPHELRRQKRYQINLHQLAFGNDNDQASDDIMQEVVRRMVNDVRGNNNRNPPS